DGIRDFHVTGVQTCALPISAAAAAAASSAFACRISAALSRSSSVSYFAPMASVAMMIPRSCAVSGATREDGGRTSVLSTGEGERSEERRVGQERRTHVTPKQ